VLFDVAGAENGIGALGGQVRGLYARWRQLGPAASLEDG
jgi:hypothetical protein